MNEKTKLLNKIILKLTEEAEELWQAVFLTAANLFFRAIFQRVIEYKKYHDRSILYYSLYFNYVLFSNRNNLPWHN